MILLARTEDHRSEPVAEVSTASEAMEIAKNDFKSRTDNDLCPYEYTLYRRKGDGKYVLEAIIDTDGRIEP